MTKQSRPMIMTYKELSSLERLTIYMSETEGRKTVRLTAKEEELLKILKVTFAYLLQSKSTQTIINLLEEQFQCSISTAYKYISDAKKFFCDVEKMEKSAERFLALKQCEEGMQRALDSKNEEMYLNYLRLKTKIQGFDRPDTQSPDFDSIQPPPIQIGFFRELLNTPLPEEGQLKIEIEKLKRSKRKSSLPFEDAKIITETGPEEGSL